MSVRWAGRPGSGLLPGLSGHGGADPDPGASDLPRGPEDGQASPDWHASLMRTRCLLVDGVESRGRLGDPASHGLGHLTGRGRPPSCRGQPANGWRSLIEAVQLPAGPESSRRAGL